MVVVVTVIVVSRNMLGNDGKTDQHRWCLAQTLGFGGDANYA